MQFMVFTDRMSHGVAAIDRQHTKLVEIINELYQIALNKQTGANLENVFDELTAYTVEHFNYEEKLFAETGYPDLESHRAQHQAFKNRVVSYRKQLVDPTDSAFAAEILHFVKQWLTQHTLGADKKACHHLTAHGVH